MKTQFTLKFLPLISRNILIILRYYFMFYPPFQARKMHEIFANTRVHPYVFEWIVAHVIHQAIFTNIFGLRIQYRDLLGVYFMQLIFNEKLVGLSSTFIIFLYSGGLNFQNPIFDSTEFNYISWLESVSPLVPSISAFERSND